jgi:hypothetical protein
MSQRSHQRSLRFGVGFRLQQIFQFSALTGDEQFGCCRIHARPPELANRSAQLADLGSKPEDLQGRGSSTATLGALDRFRVHSPIVRLEPFLDIEHPLTAAGGVPLAYEGD